MGEPRGDRDRAQSRLGANRSFARRSARERGRSTEVSESVARVEAERIAWADFEKVLLVAGTVVRVEPFPEARKPAWKVWVDFGPYGEKKTSAQIAALYAAEDL